MLQRGAESFRHRALDLLLLLVAPPCITLLQPEQIRQCLVDYASINVWQLQGADSEAPSIMLAAV